MIKKLCLLIVLSASLNAFEAGQEFIRYDEEQKKLQLALRTYQDPNTGHVVELIAMVHRAHEDFYSQIKHRLENKIVVYEHNGTSFERFKKILSQLLTLAENNNMLDCYFFKKRDSLGLIDQDALHSDLYSLSKRLIHGDRNDGFEVSESLLNSLDEEGLSLQLKNIFFTTLSDTFNNMVVCPFPLLEPSLMEEAKLALESLNKELSFPEFKEKFSLAEKHLGSVGRINLSKILDIIYKSLCMQVSEIHRNPETLPEEKKETYIGRNTYIFQALEELWPTLKEPEQIAVVYGSTHMPFIEQFLLNRGYLAQEEKWLTAVSLVQE